MDPVTLIRWAIRACRKSLTRELAAELQDQVSRDDDDTAAGKPLCDDEDPGARAALVGWPASMRLDSVGPIGQGWQGYARMTTKCLLHSRFRNVP